MVLTWPGFSMFSIVNSKLGGNEKQENCCSCISYIPPVSENQATRPSMCFSAFLCRINMDDVCVCECAALSSMPFSAFLCKINVGDVCVWLCQVRHFCAELMWMVFVYVCAALWELGRLIHDIRRKWSIPAKCPCGQNTVDTKPSGKNGMNQVRLSQFS